MLQSFYFIVSQIRRSLFYSETWNINLTCKRMIKSCGDEFCIALSNISSSNSQYTHTQTCTHLHQHICRIFWREVLLKSIQPIQALSRCASGRALSTLWLSNSTERSQWAVLATILSSFQHCFFIGSFLHSLWFHMFQHQSCLCLL